MAIQQRPQPPLSSFALHVEPPPSPVVPRPRFRGQSARPLVLTTRLLADTAAILGGLVAAQLFQQRLSAGGLAEPLNPHVPTFTAIAVTAWLALGATLGLYDSRRLLNAFDEFKLVLQAAAAGTVAATFIAFLVKVPTQRSWVLAVWGTCTLTTIAARGLHRWLLRGLRLTGVLGSRMLIVGAGREGRELHDSVVKAARWLGYRVVGFLDDDRAGGSPAAGYPPVIGGVRDVRDVVADHQVDDVLVAHGSVSEATAERVYRDLQGLPVQLHVSTGLLGVATNRVAVQRFGDVPVLGLRRVDLNGFQQTIKRVFDLAVAGLAVVVLVPVLAACALAVRLSGPGPVLFRQRRVGRDGREFTIHKFRSMVVDAEERLEALRARNEADGLLFKLHADPRVTRVGRFLRSWSLDELPQLLDVIRGHMSLVGPRPPLPSEVAAYDPWLRNRLRVKPGLTGLWQVSGRHRSTFSDYVRHDLFYVENWSLVMDLFIVLRTIPAVLARSGA
jgi:exopolysaccharide biosynthesis polyprenyl glycosylphosphotransferase